MRPPASCDPEQVTGPLGASILFSERAAAAAPAHSASPRSANETERRWRLAQPLAHGHSPGTRCSHCQMRGFLRGNDRGRAEEASPEPRHVSLGFGGAARAPARTRGVPFKR